MIIPIEWLLGPALGLAGWVTAAAVRSVRGRMVVNLEPVVAGRPIEGTVTIFARSGLGPAPLRVSLVGEEDWWEIKRPNQVEDPYRVKRTEEIYRHDFDLDGSLEVDGGNERSIVLSIPAPAAETGQVGDEQERAVKRTAIRHPENATDRPAKQRWALTVVYDLRGPSFETKIKLPLVYDLDRLEAN